MQNNCIGTVVITDGLLTCSKIGVPLELYRWHANLAQQSGIFYIFNAWKR
jgi:hypothetical protein